jgi:APA family basic amino acid/polyamine antiporter
LAVPLDKIAFNLTMAADAAQNIFGGGISIVLNAAFCVVLFSTISAVTMIGPRVYYAMARDGLFPEMAGRINPKLGTPLTAILAQWALTVFYILTGTFGDILTYMGFSLSIFPILTMAALIKNRLAEGKLPGNYYTRFFPVLPVFFMLISLIIMVASFVDNPQNCLKAIGGVLLGIPIYYLWQKFRRP